MPSREYDDELEDDEFSDDREDDDDSTVPCPHCRQPVYDDAEQCPNCRTYLGAEMRRVSVVWRVVALVLVLVLGYMWVGR